MSNLTEKLTEAGLSSKESVVYLALLEKGPIMGGKLAKILNMDRTHTYNLLNNLINKGLASHITKEKKIFFQASSPKNLLNEIKKKEQAIKSIIPRLMHLEKIKATQTKVNILEGKSGLRTMIREALESKSKELLVFGATGKSYDVLKYEMPHIAKETKLRKFKARVITSENLKKHAFTKLTNLEIRYIKEVTPSSTMIFGDKISINVFEERPLVILIESKAIADSYRKYFEYLWKVAKRI